MAIILYKEGNMAKIRGIPCQIQVCNEFSYLHLLDEGWYYTPEEVLEAGIKGKALEAETPEEEPEVDLEVEISEVETEQNELEIRATAKNAGISYWHNKSIDRLVSELKEIEDAERSED